MRPKATLHDLVKARTSRLKKACGSFHGMMSGGFWPPLYLKLSGVILLTLGLLAAGFYCPCLEKADPIHQHRYHAARGESESPPCHQHPSGGAQTPSSCFCGGGGISALIVSATPDAARKADSSPLFIENTYRAIFHSSPKRQQTSLTYRGPPSQVPIYIKNQLFLI